MRVLIATAATMTLAAAAAAGLALHSPPAKAPQHASAPNDAPAPAEAAPGLVWRSGTATLRLTDRPCPSDELTQAVETEGISKALAYEVVQGSRRFTGCWAKDIAGDVVTIEPGREIGSIPIAWFHPEPGH